MKYIPEPLLKDIIRPLPARERAAILERKPDADFLQGRIAECRRAMRRDLWVGPVWLAIYTGALFTQGYGTITISVFVMGMSYFLFTIFSGGSFGLNRKRVAVYGRLLRELDN
ncbi:MAG: hypothetical protein RLY31_2382 [Bacteroidota bacterium]